MGFLTNTSISNDFWHEIQKNPKKLTDAIGIAMNYGTNDPIGEALDEQPDAPEWSRRHAHYLRSITPQGVTIHMAAHYDTPQVIVNAHGYAPIDAARVSHAINIGWFKRNPYRKRQAEAIVETLRDEADRIERAIKRMENHAPAS